MANPIRLKILHTLKHGELSVSEILDHIGGSQANASKHLGLLRHTGLVAARRDGSNVYYRIADKEVLDICRTVCDSLHTQASAEVEALEQGRKAILS